MLIIDYENKLEKMKKLESAYANIALLLIDKIKFDIKLTQAGDIADETSVSNATITKFVKAMGFNNFKEMAYVHNAFEKEKIWVNDDKQYEEAAQLILEARKIMFIGVSNSYIVNLDFANKLMRLDKWTVISPSKYEQVGLAKILTSKDVLIVNSVSLQHHWMIEVMKKTHAKIILISSVKPQGIEPSLFFEILSDERADGFRVYTSKNRIAAYEVIDKIFYEIYKLPENKLLLKGTSYK